MRVPTWLDGWTCSRGHAFLYRHKQCPECASPLARRRLGNSARLVACTTVRVSPAADPYRLGVAVTAEGAATLCNVEGSVRGNGRDRVRLAVCDGRFVALGSGWRVTGSSRGPDARPADSQKS